MSKETDITNPDRKQFTTFIGSVCSEIEHAQVRLVFAANVQMLFHYWKLGHFILFNQKQLGWGSMVIPNISKKIRDKFPEKKGYSPRNLQYMCRFAKMYPLEILEQMLLANKELERPTIIKVISVAKNLNACEIAHETPAKLQLSDESERIAQEAFAQIKDLPTVLSIIMQKSPAEIENIFINSPVAHINWASQMVLMENKLPLGISYWYMKQQVEFSWSSNILDLQIKSGLFQSQITKKKVQNFTATHPKPRSDLANYLLKDPFMFDLAGIRKVADERDIEEQLVLHVTKYLLDMGTGFAFVARQKHFQIGNSDFFADLILYNIQLHAYVVVELKASEFAPEFTGQLNFLVNVVNDKMKGEQDNRTIGLLLCKGKSEVLARYALAGYSQPMGISDYQLSEAVPDELKSSLPTIEEVEEELRNISETE